MPDGGEPDLLARRGRRCLELLFVTTELCLDFSHPISGFSMALLGSLAVKRQRLAEVYDPAHPARFKRLSETICRVGISGLGFFRIGCILFGSFGIQLP